MELAFHPYANVFPLIDGAEFDALVADIRDHGQRQPIVLFEGAILDGRNRYRACAAAGVDPLFEEFRGDDALAYVVSLNLKRRHLDESQRAVAAAKIANLKHGQRADTAIEVSVTIPQAAEMLNVSKASVERARTVLQRGVPELQDAVEKGEIRVSAAAQIAKREADAQRELLKLPTPKAAKKEAIETGQCITARDGMIYTPMPDDEAAKRRKLDSIWHKLRDALDALNTSPSPADTLAAIPSYQHGNVTARLPNAAAWLREFEELWNEQRKQPDAAA